MCAEPTWLKRIIQCFDKETEFLVAEQVLPRIDLQILQQLWDLPASETMIHVFDVMEEQAEHLRQCAENKWRRSRGFDYLAKVSTGIKFKDGIEVTEIDQVAA